MIVNQECKNQRSVFLHRQKAAASFNRKMFTPKISLLVVPVASKLKLRAICAAFFFNYPFLSSWLA